MDAIAISWMRFPGALTRALFLSPRPQTGIVSSAQSLVSLFVGTAAEVQISQWKKQLLDGAESLFRDGRRREQEESPALQAELYERIGRLNREVEWLKKSVAHCG
jgi:hypothetical protein